MRPTTATIASPRTATSTPRGPGIQSIRGRRVQAMMQAARTPRATVETGLKKKRMRLKTMSQAAGASQTGTERGAEPLGEREVSRGRGESGRESSDMKIRI